MMKKMAWLALALMLAIAPMAGAQALGEIEDAGAIVQTACNIVQSGEYYLVYCFAQVHNNTDQIICLDQGTFQLTGGDQLLAMEPISQLWPYYLAPGEDGYLFDIASFEPDENGNPVLPNVTGLHYDVRYMTIDPMHAGNALRAAGRIEPGPRSGEMDIVCEIENPTGQDAYDATLAFGLYTEAGQMVYADGTTLYDVGIPAGGKVLVRLEVEDALAEQWATYGATPTRIDVTAMFSSGGD